MLGNSRSMDHPFPLPATGAHPQATLFSPCPGPQSPTSSSPQEAKSGATWLSTVETDCSTQPKRAP